MSLFASGERRTSLLFACRRRLPHCSPMNAPAEPRARAGTRGRRWMPRRRGPGVCRRPKIMDAWAAAPRQCTACQCTLRTRTSRLSHGYVWFVCDGRDQPGAERAGGSDGVPAARGARHRQHRDPRLWSAGTERLQRDFESTCHHPLLLFNREGDCLAVKLGARRRTHRGQAKGVLVLACGGDGGTRTRDPLRAKQVLSR